MDLRAGNAIASFTALAAVVAVLSAATASSADLPTYNNHTVGGLAGWLFNPTTSKPAVDYAAWASKLSFSLGDYLIFNTNGNSTVFQTYNETTYRLCSAENDTSSLTTQFGGGSRGAGAPQVIAVPLTVEGDDYYFSDAYDGEQCQKGMRFKIKVQHGRGLPPELSQPPPPPVGNGTPSTPPADGSSQQETFYRGGAVGGGPGKMGLMGIASCVLLVVLRLG